MDKDIRNIAIVFATTATLLYVFRPRNRGYFSLGKYQPPKKAKPTDREYENAVIGVKAVHAALLAGEPNSVIKDITKEVKESDNISLEVKSSKIVAKDKTGNQILSAQYKR